MKEVSQMKKFSVSSERSPQPLLVYDGEGAVRIMEQMKYLPHDHSYSVTLRAHQSEQINVSHSNTTQHSGSNYLLNTTINHICNNLW